MIEEFDWVPWEPEKTFWQIEPGCRLCFIKGKSSIKSTHTGDFCFTCGETSPSVHLAIKEMPTGKESYKKIKMLFGLAHRKEKIYERKTITKLSNDGTFHNTPPKCSTTIINVNNNKSEHCGSFGDWYL